MHSAILILPEEGEALPSKADFEKAGFRISTAVEENSGKEKNDREQGREEKKLPPPTDAGEQEAEGIRF